MLQKIKGVFRKHLLIHFRNKKIFFGFAFGSVFLMFLTYIYSEYKASYPFI